MKQNQSPSLNFFQHITGRPNVAKRYFILNLDTETISYYPSQSDRSKQQIIYLRVSQPAS